MEQTHLDVDVHAQLLLASDRSLRRHTAAVRVQPDRRYHPSLDQNHSLFAGLVEVDIAGRAYYRWLLDLLLHGLSVSGMCCQDH